jgi:hypothetical protein
MSPVAEAPDGDCPTTHLRCGSDVFAALRSAGFSGRFLGYADPYCQGPVCAGPDLEVRRARFLATAYGLDLAEVRARLRRESDGLAKAAETERLVLWFEHDSYDQLILARVLHAFAKGPRPAILELVCIDGFPGMTRFIGLGQLAPNELLSLWPLRAPVGADQLALGRAVWLALSDDSPVALHRIAAAGTPAIPQMAGALQRHLQELPWTTDGLSLTQRLVLESLREGPRTGSEVFRSLLHETEPLPFLGDRMFWHVLHELGAVADPPFAVAGDNRQAPWPHRRLALTRSGVALLEARADWLSCDPRPRWVGGVCIRPGVPAWRWTPAEARPVKR